VLAGASTVDGGDPERFNDNPVFDEEGEGAAPEAAAAGVA
jgi:hypothetical protein